MALNAVLSPNIVPGTAVNVKFLEQELLTVNGALGVIKKGQRIVDRGDCHPADFHQSQHIPRHARIRTATPSMSPPYFMVGQALLSAHLLHRAVRVPLPYTGRSSTNPTKKIAFLVTFHHSFRDILGVDVRIFRQRTYFVPYAMVPVVILVFFDSRTAIFSLVVTVMICALVSVYPFQFIFLELAAGLTAAFKHQHPESALAARAQHFSHFWPTARPTPPSGSSPTATSPISNGVPSEPLPSTQWCSFVRLYPRARSRKKSAASPPR